MDNQVKKTQTKPPTQNSGRNSGKKGRVENLKPWPKGVSGNPGGRPKSKVLSQACGALLEREVPGDSQGRTYAEMIAVALVKKAMKGDVQAARELADRTEGKAQQSIALSQSTEDPYKGKSTQELEYYCRTGLWPTTEELEHYAKTGKWPHETCPNCRC